VIFGAVSKWTGADDSPECSVAKSGNEILKEPKLTIGLDLGDRSSHYCILDEAGKVILEHDLPTTPKGVQQIDVLAGYPNCEVPLNAIYSCLDAAYLTLQLPLQHFLRFRRDFWPISISTLAMAAPVSASSSVMSFSDPSWLKSLLGSKKAILASFCRTRSTEMSSRCCRSSITCFSSAWTLTFLALRKNL
jgi:hypothetical protein